MSARIIHEIGHRTETGGGTRLYASPPGKKGHDGFHVTLWAINPGTQTELDDLHIEGAARDVRDMLLAMLETVELCGDSYVEDGDVRSDWRDPRPDPRKARKPQPKKAPKRTRATKVESAKAILPSPKGPMIVSKRPVVIQPAAQKPTATTKAKIKKAVRAVARRRDEDELEID